MLRDHAHRFHLGLRRWYAAARGYRIYLLAFVLAVPDMLDALSGFDWAAILPPGWGVKAGSYVAIARIVLGIYIRRLPPPPPAVGGPR
jgi:hypothetical protein